MKRDWTPEEIIDTFTLTWNEIAWVSGATDYNQLGLAILLKFLEHEGRFPEDLREIPAAMLEYIAQQLDIAADRAHLYDWSGRSQRDHRLAIRERFGFRKPTADDEEALADWLSNHPSLTHDQKIASMKALALEHLRDLRIEPPTPDRLDRFVRSGLRRFETRLFHDLMAQLPDRTLSALDDLVPEQVASDDLPAIQHTPFARMKGDPGLLSLAGILREADRLKQLQAIYIPPDLFSGLSVQILKEYRQTTAAEAPSELRKVVRPRKYVLLAAFVVQRRREVTDNLVEMLVQLTYKIRAKAKQRVDKIVLDEVRQPVHGKLELFYKVAVAAVANPDGRVRDVLFPIVSEEKLRAVIEEREQTGSYQHQIYTRFRSSYSHHYRRMLPALLDVLEFRSNNAAYQPVIQALGLVRCHLDDTDYNYPAGEEIPIEDVVPVNWQEFVLEGRSVNRINYEVSVLQALRAGLLSHEIWVAGADKHGNPDDHVPADYEQKREIYYAEIRRPLSAQEFTQSLRNEMREALGMFNMGLPDNQYVSISPRGGGWIKVTPLPAQTEPVMLSYLGHELQHQWGPTTLLDVFKEAALRTGFLDDFKSVASREVLDPMIRDKRLLLCLYGLGTNVGLRQMSMGEHSESYDDLLYMRQRYIRPAGLRPANARVVNATFEARLSHIWGAGSVSVASDQRHFPSRGDNLMTDWYPRHPMGRGVSIYWHIERRSAGIYCQLKSPLASEVATMIEGVLHHLTQMDIQRAFVDHRGQSEMGFGIMYLLGYELMARLGNLHKQKLYLPEPGQRDAYPNLQLILTRPIEFDKVERQYDEMIKYVTALRLGTLEADAMLKRFTHSTLMHPTFEAFLEVGRAAQTIFLCKLLHIEQNRRDMQEIMNVIENWNSGTTLIRFGRGGEFTSSRIEDQEVSALSLQLLMNSLVFVNTLMIQDVLSIPAWYDRMTPADWRGITPLIYRHINPYGLFDLNMAARLPLGEPLH